MDVDLDPGEFLQALVNGHTASVAERPYWPDQQGPATTVAGTEENKVLIFDACGEACPENQYRVNGQSLWMLGEDGWLAVQAK